MNKPRCKIGDLCLILRGSASGKMCTIVGAGSGRPHVQNSRLKLDWKIRMPSPIKDAHGVVCVTLDSPDDVLLPINPGDLNELTEFESDKVKGKSHES